MPDGRAELHVEIHHLRAALLDCVLRLRSHGVNAHDCECAMRRHSVMMPCTCGLDDVLQRAKALLEGVGQ